MTREPGIDVVRTAHAGGEVLRLRFTGRGRLNLAGSLALRRGAETIAGLAADRDVRCAVLSGAGPEAFIGGADLQELGSLTPASAEAFIRGVHEFCSALRAFPVPVVACIEGYCLGAGLEIAAACDFRVSDTSARFGMPEVRVGVPSVIEAALLPGLIGWGRTRELVFRGHLIGAEEAARIGLVEQVVAPSALASHVAAVVADICAGAPGAIRTQKALVRQWEALPLDAAIEAGVAAFVAAYDGPEPAECVARFFAHRKPAKEEP